MLVCQVDLRPGGVFLYSMKAPDGKVLWGKWVYRTIVAAERMVTVVSFCDEKGNIPRHPMSATFAGGQDSMKKGYAATLDQLDAYLAHLGQAPRAEN